LVRFINIEIKNAKAGRSAYIHLKMNSIVDTSLIEKLYAASNAGVKVRLVVRGICSLIPGIEGLSENIEVISIIDRYLEHARFYCFCNDGNPLYFISSADWMVRNIDRRIEVTCPIYSKEIIEEIDHTFEVQFSDNVKGRRLQSDGQYKVQKKKGDKRVKSQSELFQHYKMLAKK
jgi:polyphosphate kinase